MFLGRAVFWVLIWILSRHISPEPCRSGANFEYRPHPWEHLMIMYYDVMLIDDDPVVHRPHTRRRKLLERLVSPVKGRADLVWQKHVRFDRPTGPEKLKKALAMAFVLRWEGLVLKPSDEPYFNLGGTVQGRFPSRWVKLKKDCIKGLGDTADFAVIGAGYEVTEAQKYKGMSIRWTHFHIGCLKNKAAVLNAGEKPRFLIFDLIKDCISREDMKTLTENGYLRAMGTELPETWEMFDIELARGLPSMSVIFRKPFVFDVAGSGFDRSPNRNFFTLRFPRLIKVRLDRSWKETVDLDELQHMATEARTVIPGDLSDDVADWIEKLNNIDRGAGGKMKSWDPTDDEEDEHSLIMVDLKASTPKVNRRPRAAAAPPLIRMDTKEMRDKERRLSNGAVVEQPYSKHTLCSITSDGTLQTPPNSSPLSKDNDVTHSNRKWRIPSEDSHGHSKKRSAEREDKEESTRDTKRARPLQHSKSEPWLNDKACSPNPKKPLGENTNLARPPRSKQQSTPIFSLVRKTTAGTEERYRRKNKKSRIYVEPSSASRETTASESTSTDSTTTQQIIFEEILSARLLLPDRAETKAPSLPTPPSTAESTSSMQIPNIQECDLMLTPALLDQNHPVNGLIYDHYKTALQFPTSPPAEGSTPHFKSRPRCELIILVESNDTHAVGWNAVTLLHHVVHWHPRGIMLWDWRLLAYKLPQSMDERQRKALLHKFFVAKMWWDPRATKEQGAVVVKWCAAKKNRQVLKADLDMREWVKGI